MEIIKFVKILNRLLLYGLNLRNGKIEQFTGLSVWDENREEDENDSRKREKEKK